MKRKKVLMTTVALGTALLGTNVQADELEQQLPPVSEASLAVANEVATTNPVAQASADVEKLKLELDHQEEVVTASQNQLSSQTDLVTQRQEELKQEEGAVLLAKETEEKAKTELKEVTTDQVLALEKEHPEIALVLNESSEANAVKTKIEQELAQQETNLASIHQQEATALEKLNQTQAEVSQSQDHLSQATEEFNNLGQKQAVLLQDIEKAQANLDKTGATLEAAKLADQERLSAVQAAETELERLVELKNQASSLNLEQAKQELSKAQEEERLASQRRDAASREIKNLEASLVNSPDQAQTPRIEIMDGYNLDLSTSSLLALINRNGGKSSKYTFNEKLHTSSQDRSTMLNISNLTEQTLKELNEYGMRILNQMKADYRQKTGQTTSKVVLSDDSINLAKIVADTYEEDGFNNFKEPGHNQNAFDKALRYQNATHLTEDINAKGPYHSPNITKATAKQMIYDALYNMIYRDDHVDYAHAKSILGRKHPNEQYLGLDFSYVGAVDRYPGTISVHIIKTNGFRNHTPNTSGYLNSEAEYQASLTINRSQVEIKLDAQRQNLTRATADLTLAQTNQRKAKSQIDSLSQALKTDDTSIAAQREAVAKAKAISLKTPEASALHQQSLDQLNTLKADYSKLGNDILSKKVIVDDTIKVLADKTAALEAARNNLVLAKGRVEVETTKLNFLKGKLAEALEHLNKLDTAKRNLLKEKYEVVKELEAYQAAKVEVLNAREAVLAAEERVNSLKASLIEAQEKLENHKESHRQALLKRDQIQDDLDDKTKSLAELQKLSENHHLSWQNGVLIATPKMELEAQVVSEQKAPLVKSQTQSATAPESVKPLSQTGQVASSPAATHGNGQAIGQATTTAKTLPQTGEEANVLTVLAGVSLLAGLSASKGKRKEDK